MRVGILIDFFAVILKYCPSLRLDILVSFETAIEVAHIFSHQMHVAHARECVEEVSIFAT